MGNKRIWYFGFGSYRRGVHVGNGATFARIDSIFDQLFVGQKGFGSLYHLLDFVSILSLGRHTGKDFIIPKSL